MPGVLVKDGAAMVRHGGLVVGQCGECCNLAPSNHYYKFEACPTGGPFDPCGIPNPLPGLSVIYVAHDLTCLNGGQTIEAMVLAALANNQTPVIRWAGWCYRWVESCWFPKCPALPNPCGVLCNVLPPNAQGPSGPVVCLTGCDALECRSAAYVFLKKCPGNTFGGTAPQVYICLSDIYPFFAAGGKCPVYQISGAGCWYADWQNASATKPANYARFQSSPTHDGCCTCLGPPCVYTEGHQCSNSGGLTGLHTGPLRCCANALSGVASLIWSIRSYDVAGLRFQKVGRADRSGLTLTGSWRKLDRISPGVYAPEEQFTISGVFAPSSHFNPLSTIGADVNSTPGDKTWSGFPCPGGIGPVGVWRATCTLFTMRATTTDANGYIEFAANWTCSPNPGVCETGCPENVLSAPSYTVSPGGPGDSGGGLDAAIEDMARRQLGQGCRGCGG